jgi:2-oxoglutarate ferredoxin oxidoreductase subunit delta
MSTGALLTAKERSVDPVVISHVRCKACGICIAFCPKECLAADEHGKAYLAAPERCTRCGLCEVRCPDFAVRVESRDRHAVRS